MNPNIDSKLADYRVVRETGRGAMSTVYEAIDERTGQTVALKVLLAPASLPPEQQRSLIARMGREARLIARLSHPNIVRILDVGQDAGRHYLVMEFLHGTTLRERLDAGPLPLPEVSLVVDQVAAALDAIHSHRIVHRDIKPSNVMLLPDGHVKLMDFGVARQGDDTTITQAGMIVGSPAYMSPEQIRGEDGTPASDLWALGVLLYEMLAGRSPFPGTNIPAVLYKVTHDPPAPIAGAPPTVQRVLRRALEKKPPRRYRTARELADALRAAFVTPPAPHRPSARSAPASLTAGWARVLLPAGGLLAVIAGALFLAHATGRPHNPPNAPALINSPGLRSLPAVDVPPPTAAAVKTRPHPSRLLHKAFPKPLSTRRAVGNPARKPKARRRLSHAEQAWANHLRRLAARRAAPRRSAPRRPARAAPRRVRQHDKRPVPLPRQAPPRRARPRYEPQMPAHPVYDPASPG